ncbi:MAG: TIGR01620 family protein, partial [Paracoccaceae bacterium]
MTEERRRGPRLIEDGLEDLPPAPAGPDDAPPIDDEAPPAARAALRASSPGGGLARLFWAAFGGLFIMALGLWFWEVVDALLARNLWLGRVALALALLAGTALSLIALRELSGLARLRRIDGLREAAEHARAARDRGAAMRTLSSLDALYRSRAELAAPRAEIAARKADMVDGDALIDLAERWLLTPLDAAAASAVKRGARDVATATALIPLAIVDVLAALAINLRMIRAVAAIYGGRAGWLGSWRLFRAVAAHLAAAGLIAVGDDLIGPALGGGVMAKLSRRFGEGVANGALTARIGVAAIDVCRPLPFSALPRP